MILSINNNIAYQNKYRKIVIAIFFSILLNNYHHPKISIFIPIHNMEKYLPKAFLNLQKQTLKDIEIIAVNDYSNDKSLEIIKEYAKKDRRIKIINNKKNKGLLYSRAMGIIHSSGDYLMNFDADDELVSQDALEYLYNKTLLSKTDIISFNYITPKRNFKNPCKEFDKIIRQPKLFKAIYTKNYNLKDFLIWNKLIKKDIFLNAFKLFKNYIYSDKKWNYHEDNIWSILVNKLATTKLCVRKVIYKYNYSNNSLLNNRYNPTELNNIIYRFDMIRQIFSKDINYRYMKYECIYNTKEIIIRSNFKNYIKSNYDLKNLSHQILQKCLNNYKIPKTKKKYIIKLIKFFK